MPPNYQLPITNYHSPRPPRFTLIELLVVMGIIVILATLSIPAIKTLTNGNNQKQAANLITTLIAAAHANALQSHTYAGIVFYEDPNHAGQTAVQLIQASTTSTLPTISFIRQPRTIGQPLARGIEVATLDGALTSGTFGVNTASNGGTLEGRAILFDPNGQLTMNGNLKLDTSLSADKAAAAWNLGNASSTPGLFIYDQQALQTAKDTNLVQLANPQSFSQWVNANADVLIINPYTGNLIR